MTARDADIGLTNFYTRSAALGGRLKVRISDFIVDEVGGEPSEDPRGKYTCAILRLTNWETNSFVREASERLQMSRKRVRFSGTKDKRGVTTRVFTFEASPEAVQELGKMPGVEVDRLYRTSSESNLGDHTSNRFEIVVRDVALTPDEITSQVERTRQEAEAKGGYPNVFGPQRFGAVRATTHLVGERIVHGDFAGAVRTYLGTPSGLPPDKELAWTEALAKGDYNAAMQFTHNEQSLERALLHRMHEDPKDPIGALLAFPKNLQLLFVSAFQSWLFNRIVCKRIKEGLALDRPLIGDLIAPFENGQMREEWIPVTPNNQTRIAEEIQRGRAVITGLLPGTEVPFATGQPGRIEDAVLKEAAVTRSSFVVPEHLEWSSKGIRRPLLVKPQEWSVSTAPDEFHPGRSCGTFAFVLPRGAYATSVLREFLKADDLRTYG